jgi:ATP-dependent helicase/DNAse subunit B
MKQKKPFQDFDSFRDEKYNVRVGDSYFEIWHTIGLEREEIEKVAKEIFEGEISRGKKPQLSYRFDFRPYI